VPDGFTVILGGIEQESETEGESRVPFLGSIPLLGVLFKSRSTTKTKSRFFCLPASQCPAQRVVRRLEVPEREADGASGTGSGNPTSQAEDDSMRRIIPHRLLLRGLLLGHRARVNLETSGYSVSEAGLLIPSTGAPAVARSHVRLNGTHVSAGQLPLVQGLGSACSSR
jgi:hypothetical protein